MQNFKGLFISINIAHFANFHNTAEKRKCDPPKKNLEINSLLQLCWTEDDFLKRKRKCLINHNETAICLVVTAETGELDRINTELQT